MRPQAKRFLGHLPRALSWPGAGTSQAAGNFEPNYERSADPLSFLSVPQWLSRVPFQDCAPHSFGEAPWNAVEGALPPWPCPGPPFMPPTGLPGGTCLVPPGDTRRIDESSRGAPAPTREGTRKKSVRRPDLSPETRARIALEAFQNQGVWGAMAQLAQRYRVSRQFIYLLLWSVTAVFKPDFSTFEAEATMTGRRSRSLTCVFSSRSNSRGIVPWGTSLKF